MKGIVLAGGLGTRLHPLTLSTSKQLLPVYDKPMVYYPLAVLMLAGIREIAIISTPHDLPRFVNMLGSGEQLGLTFTYIEQPEPKGIAQAFILAEEFIAEDSVALILGDNIFYGHSIKELLEPLKNRAIGATVFGYEVQDPSRYGVLAFDQDGKVSDIIEKPKNPPSSYAVTGLYFYDNNVVNIAKNLQPSARGELEITDVNLAYLRQGSLSVKLMGRGFAWLDTGTYEALQQAATYVQTIQNRQGIKIACIEEIAFQMGFISLQQLCNLASFYSSSEYGIYIKKIADEASAFIV